VIVARTFDLEHELSRRKFLAGLGLAGTVVAGSYAVDTWGRPLAAGAAASAPKLGGKKGRTVVFVELAGGNDGIGTVIPYTDPNYRRLRPTLAIDTPLDLDGSVGLHPGLAKLADRYRAGRVAIVEGIGYPNNDLSHFASLANWWSGTPGHASSTGWLVRPALGLIRLGEELPGARGPGSQCEQPLVFGLGEHAGGDRDVIERVGVARLQTQCLAKAVEGRLEPSLRGLGTREHQARADVARLGAQPSTRQLRRPRVVAAVEGARALGAGGRGGRGRGGRWRDARWRGRQQRQSQHR